MNADDAVEIFWSSVLKLAREYSVTERYSLATIEARKVKIGDWEMSHELNGNKLTVRWKKKRVPTYFAYYSFANEQMGGGAQPLWRNIHNKREHACQSFPLAGRCFDKLKGYARQDSDSKGC